MEDILASIRRILSEDEQPAKPAAAAPPEPAPPAAAPAALAAPEDDDVLKLDESMLVGAREAAPVEPVDEGMALVEAISAPGEPLEVAPAMPEPVPEPPPPVIPIAMPLAAPAMDRLIAPEAEAATASSVSSLLRTLDSTRQAGGTLLYRGGPTLEDMVREEIRPLLKAWLDENLPPVVERLVRAEIERVVGRAVG
jgi:cell pole-organizing protein PopZ